MTECFESLMLPRGKQVMQSLLLHGELCNAVIGKIYFYSSSELPVTATSLSHPELL